MDYDEIRRLHAEGMSDVAIAKVLGLSQATIWRRRTEMGLGVNPRPPSVDVERLETLVRDGHTDLEAADELDVHPKTVSRWRRRIGLHNGRVYDARRRLPDVGTLTWALNRTQGIGEMPEEDATELFAGSSADDQ